MSAANGLVIPSAPSALAGALPGILGYLDAESGKGLTAFQPVVATAKLNAVIIARPGKVTSFRGKALINGTVADTVVKLKKIPKDGVVAAAVEVASLTIGQAPADGLNTEGTLSAVAGATDLAVGDLLYIEVTAAATGASDLTVQAGYVHVL